MDSTYVEVVGGMLIVYGLYLLDARRKAKSFVDWAAEARRKVRGR
ncbi:hypothetical protein [Dyella subtropica]|nr:hypothetical protein [Dyella subtropica]